MVSIPPGSSLGRYRIVKQLGRGGMATVFRCHDPNLDRYVAVKVLPSYQTEDPTFTARFTQEAQTVAKLNHPNILQIYDFGEDKGFSYIVSELVPGGDLQDKLGKGPLPTEDVLRFMGPLAEALDYAHGQGIIHRDLKPANVLLDADERPILADSGLARMLESAIRFTQASQALGTPEYMSPEQAMGANADHRSDLYAFGIMMYQMLLGETPFRADTPAATLMAHVHKPLPLPTAVKPDVEPMVESILLKALAKDPEDRYNAAMEMIRAVEVATGLAKEAPPADDLGATAVLDTAGLDTLDATDAATAVIGTGEAAAEAGETGVMAKPAEAAAAAAEAPAFPRWLLAAGGVGVVVVVAVVAAVVVGKPFSPAAAPPAATGGESPAETPAAPAPAAAETSAESTEAAAEAPVAEPTREISVAEALAALDELRSRAEANVIKLRDVTLDGSIETQLKTREDLASISRGFFRRDYLRQEVFEKEELYKTLGLMEESQDLEEILMGIQLQQVFALFDDEAEKVYVATDALGIGPLEELGYASAYMAGIQQRVFNVSGLRRRAREADYDQLRALDALVGGDVAQVRNGYIGTFLSRDDVEELRKPIAENKLPAAPEIIQKTALFSQREGVNFVAELYGRDGWESVKAAYGRPPLSTEQVLHPDKYFADEQPQRTVFANIAPKMGKGWVQVSGNTMGEFMIRSYLEEYLDDIQAEDAAAGWGGDRYSLLTGPEAERVLIWMIAWDSFDESAEFFGAYQVFVGVKFQTQGITASSSAVGQSGRKWVAPDETIFLGQLGPTVLLIIGDDEDIVSQALDHLFAALEEQAP